MAEQRFQLRISVRIEQLVENTGHPGQWYPAGSQGLEVSDSLNLTARGFMEMAAVLGRFHELGEKLRAEQEVNSHG